MKIFVTKPFEKDYEELPEYIKKIAQKQLNLLLERPQHPSLRVKRIEDPRDIWEGRVTKNYRFTFQLQNDVYLLRRIGTHDILRTP